MDLVLPICQEMDGILLEVECNNHSGLDEAIILKAAHMLYEDHIGLEHWYEMLKDQLKGKTICDPPKLGLGLSKRSNLNIEEPGDKGVAGVNQPNRWKSMKKRGNEKAKNIAI